MFSCLCALILTMYENVESAESTANAVGCQYKTTHGRDYRGTANTTVDGIPCQKWSDVDFTDVEDHNYCRNPPADKGLQQVWCFVNDASNRSKEAACSVPFCPLLKVLDFSLGEDW